MKFAIYHREREYAREMGDPQLTEVEAATKEEAERLTAHLGLTGTLAVPVVQPCHPQGIMANHNRRSNFLCSVATTTGYFATQNAAGITEIHSGHIDKTHKIPAYGQLTFWSCAGPTSASPAGQITILICPGNHLATLSPTLFFGGMTGVVVAGLVNLQWPVAQADVVTLAVVGMSACLGAVVWAPVTGILIVFEMTHQFSLVPALMIAALVSQTVSRKMNRENFYDALPTQDGHQLEHVRSPRGLQGWQQLPVSAIANFRPAVAGDLDPAEIRKLLQAHPYQRFPITKEARLAGILTRKEAEAAPTEKRAARLEPATTCLPGQTIRQLQALLIESSTGLVVLTAADGQAVLGVVTLHDQLRAELEKATASEE